MKPQTTLRRIQLGTMTLVIASSTGLAVAQRDAPPDRRDSQVRGSEDPPPIPLPKSRPQQPRINPPPPPPGTRGGTSETVIPDEFRRIDGVDNNVGNPELGSSDEPYYRLLGPDYEDGVGAPSGADRPSAREVSNALCAQSEPTLNRRGATDFLWQWGQFVDHDIDETPAASPPELFNIQVPAGDPWFDPQGTGTVEIPLNRSHGEEVDGVREQVNGITAFIDASNVYGSTEERAFALRALDGTGKLKTTVTENGDLLPYNNSGLPNAPADTPNFFLAGDVRANEQVGLTAMHTLFVREHNHWADRYNEINPSASGEEIYQFARLIVGAEMQVITYREFLPVLLGPDAIPPYRGYDPEVDPTISNVFAAAAYRLGHSLLSPDLLRLDAAGDEAEEGHLSLAAAFFTPAEIEDHGIESVLRGLAGQTCQELDGELVDAVRNFLFGPPGSGGFDLAALNMQRGRDHGLPSFNASCRQLGIRPARSFRAINPDPEVWRPMASVYDNVNQVDCWIGGLCEPHVRGAMVGPLNRRILADQFIRLRDGDRFWYQNYLPPALVRLVEGQALARIIRRNTKIGDELPNNVFLSEGTREVPPQQAPGSTKPRKDPAKLSPTRRGRR